MNLFITIIAFIFAIGILVTFHELGHFYVARRLGVKVLRFSVGFGMPLFRWHDKHQTEYVIAILPLGGYVKMLDEREAPVPEKEKQWAFNTKPLWARFLIVLAGPLFNFIFAILAYWLMFMIGISGAIPKIGEVTPYSIAAKAGLKAEQEIVMVDHVSTKTWQQVMKQLMRRLGDKDYLEIEIKQPNGILHSHSLNLSEWELKGNKPDLLHALGIKPYQPPIPPIIHDVMSGEPGERAGIQPNDVIVAVEGKPLSSWQDLTDVTTKSIGRPLRITFSREGEKKEVQVTPRGKESGTGETIGFIGLVVKTTKMPEALMRKERLGPFQAFSASIEKTSEYTGITFKVIGRMLTGEIGLHTLSGPITIAQGAGAMAVIGFQYYLGFLALISISLGVLNLLPIPILDGGHLLYYVIEMLTGKPVSERFQMIGFKIGMFVLITLMGIAFYNDLSRLF